MKAMRTKKLRFFQPFDGKNALCVTQMIQKSDFFSIYEAQNRFKIMKKKNCLLIFFFDNRQDHNDTGGCEKKRRKFSRLSGNFDSMVNLICAKFHVSSAQNIFRLH